jgi:hypothetical protein
MKLTEPNLPDILYVAYAMREADRREIYATRFSESPDELAMSAIGWGKFAWVAHFEDRPVAYIGAGQMWPGVWTVWMFATDEFPKIGLPLTKFVKRSMIPAIRAAGAHLAMCWSIVGHDHAHRWLKCLGAEAGPPMPGYGKNGETFIPFTWR